MRDVALTALLKLLEQAVEPAVEHRSGGGAAENSAQRATQQVTKAAAEVAALSARHAGADVTARGAGWLGRRRVGPAQILHRVDRKKSKQRLARRRHALAPRPSSRARNLGDTATGDAAG